MVILRRGKEGFSAIFIADRDSCEVIWTKITLMTSSKGLPVPSPLPRATVDIPLTVSLDESSFLLRAGPDAAASVSPLPLGLAPAFPFDLSAVEAALTDSLFC